MRLLVLTIFSEHFWVGYRLIMGYGLFFKDKSMFNIKTLGYQTLSDSLKPMTNS